MQDRNWTLTQEAFERLLARLGPDRDAAAQEYERIRRGLADFFAWRRSKCPDTDADETLDRVAQKLEQGERIERVADYAYGVAKRVILQWPKHHAREQAALHVLQWSVPNNYPHADVEEDHVACMERCLDELPEESRALILLYYTETTASPLAERRLLAQRLGLTYGSLRTRAYRTRAQLEECLRKCLRRQPRDSR
jgi:DNA-directed RNA polymerase specialized sigma24 family protein